MNDKPIDKRKKYKQKQVDMGMVRFELQIPIALKERFENMAQELSEEYAAPEDPRQRLSKAKIQLLEELLDDTKHEFFNLKDKLSKQEKLIAALSPSFDVREEQKDLPIPKTIQDLPDDPKELKRKMSSLFIERQSLQLQNQELKRRNTQYLKLYETVLEANEKTVSKI